MFSPRIGIEAKLAGSLPGEPIDSLQLGAKYTKALPVPVIALAMTVRAGSSLMTVRYFISFPLRTERPEGFFKRLWPFPEPSGRLHKYKHICCKEHVPKVSSRDFGRFLNLRDGCATVRYFLSFPLKYSTVACPGWLIPSRLITFHAVSRMILISSRNDQ